MYKIIGADRKEYGPYPAEHIRQWIASGRCNASTLAQLEGTTAWTPLVLLPEFKSVLAQSAPPVIPSRVPQPPVAASSPRNNVFVILGIIGAVALGGIALIGLLATIAIPNFVRARQQAQTNLCRERLQLLSGAIEVYTTGHDGQLPPANTWTDALSKQISSTNTFQCPADQSASLCSFAFNKNLDGKKLDEVAPKTVVLFESDSGWNGVGAQADMVSRGHRPAGGNMSISNPEKIFHVILADGSFVSVSESETDTLRWEP
ncbi:MAG: hypothetical protein JWQ71_1595 [Pedosphaera sp.]|nr:hypothetical protein [Pedosphaera sp.]